MRDDRAPGSPPRGATDADRRDAPDPTPAPASPAPAGGDATAGKGPGERWVVYVDMDAFYVACEVREAPELAGRPVIVGPDPKRGPTRGVVLSASYEARRFGVRSAMPVGAADRRCPEAVWRDPDFRRYERAAEEVRATLRRFADRVEPLSIDEAALVVERPTAEAAESLARAIQRALAEELRLPATVGVAPNRVVAKIASDVAKPGGVRVVAPSEVAAFLAPLPVRAIPGVGPKTEERLRAAGVERVAQLREVPRAVLAAAVGGFAGELRRIAEGRYVDPPPSDAGPRSRSVEETFEADLTGLEAALAALDRLAVALAEELGRERLGYRTVTVAVRWSDFTRVSRSRSLPIHRGDAASLVAEGRRLLAGLWADERRGRGRALRMLSVGAERLVPVHGRLRTLESYDAGADAIK